MERILFQGDSITDCGRVRENIQSLGTGYPLLVGAKLGAERPGKYEFINRGISGNRVPDLYARIKIDFINLKPAYLSILIGVNDVWHEASFKNGTSEKKFEMIYDMLLSEIKEALPETKILVMEPFCLFGAATQDTQEQPGRWDYFRTEVPLRAAAAKRVAEKHGVGFLPLQNVLDAACEKAPAEHWLRDGVHPTPQGHELICREWMKAFEGGLFS